MVRVSRRRLGSSFVKDILPRTLLASMLVACGARTGIDLASAGAASIPDGGSLPDAQTDVGGVPEASLEAAGSAETGSQCTNECPTSGSTTCQSGGIAACAADDAGCLAWGLPITCEAGEACVDVDAGPLCVAIAAPRPIAPLSTATVTSQTPSLHWALPAGETGAHVDLCEDRACATLVTSFVATGSSAAPASPLGRGVYYWRLRGVVDGIAGAAVSPVWEFFVGARSAAVDTSWGTVADVNGDGFADALIGDPGAIVDGTPFAGEVSVYLGGAAGLSSTPTTLQAPFAGSFPELGTSVASAGDVNGDGFADVIAGAPEASGESPGAAYLYLGGPAGVSATPTKIPAPANEASFGWSVSSAGDVNGDGYADVAVLALQRNVYVYLGGSSGLSPTPTAVGGSQSSSASAGACDVNGDGFGDLVLGSPGSTGSGGVAETGSASVYLGGTSGLPQTPIALFGPATPYEWLGYTVACAGDVNGDGYADLAIGAPGEAPAVYVFLGGPGGPSQSQPALNNPSTTLYGLTSPVEYNFAGSLGAAGDVNGDGYDDLLVGAPGNAGNEGAAFLYLGGAGGLSSTPVALPPGANTGYFGRFLAGGGDLNGDKFDDVLVSAPLANTIVVFLGSSGGLSPAPPLTSESGPAAL
jgi:hypothetical protein